MSGDLRYKRLLLKLSGEALMGTMGYGIDPAVVRRLAREVVEARAAGCKISVVIGGGNIFRGVAGAAAGMDRVDSDYMGMLATVMNALAFRASLDQMGIPARVFSAIPMTPVCEPYAPVMARRYMDDGGIAIFAAGTGNPYFTTDTAAVLRAIEMECEAAAKATKVDGVYTADPVTDKNAVRFDRLSYAEVLARGLKVMDGAAIALARDNDLPIIVFAIGEAGNLPALLRGEARATLISRAS